VGKKKERNPLEELEGVGPKTLERLRVLGATSVEHLAEFTVEKLVETGVEYERAVKILQQAIQRVGTTRPTTAKELRSQQRRAFKTGVSDFDEKTPWHGVREAFIYEFAGKLGAGKSMLAHQLSVAA